MVNFVLRHNSTKLKDRYVAPLFIEEAMEEQEIMEEFSRQVSLKSPDFQGPYQNCARF